MTTRTVGDTVGLPLPDGWEVMDVKGLDVVIAGPSSIATAAGTPFRPSVSALVAPTGPTDVRTLGTQALAAAQALGGHVVAYDVWPVAGGQARRLVSTLLQGDVPTCVTQWVSLRAGTATTLTATCAVTQYTRLAPLLDAIASHALGTPTGTTPTEETP